ncbi:hypothetical protein SCRM01_123c [Synechococcus phage S-CRM01]|uniref:hypothetical protein n=1 Tax=Synechococcus phage S-CRM01 TaxID=1026955 RepID=UPI000209E3B7|nr:hypothetical protein SCRM01_123c [Synechococcus phage S-CRM01]AEC53069.1 hypothetical protein SCRM01_123c [Synechococcus phage S-CRM01]
MAYPIDPNSAAFAPYVGSLSTTNPVADSDDLYVSSVGIAIRRWKDKAGTRFWDELLVPFEVQTPPSVYTDATAPLGGTGPQYPVYNPVLGGQVTVAVAPGSVAEDGAPNLVFTFSRNTSSRNVLTVNYNITGTATNGVDYETIGNSVTFAEGAATATVVVNPIADAGVEPNETVILTIVPNGAYTIGTPNSATGTITNDDA